MLRYICVVWDAANSEDCTAADSVRAAIRRNLGPWPVAVDAPGLLVCSLPNAPYKDSVIALDSGAGALLGIAFARNGEGAICTPVAAHVASSVTANLIATQGRSAVEVLWGSYVLILRLPQGRVIVLRAPMSRLACFHSVVGRVHVFFSVPEDFAQLNLLKLQINWDRVCAQAARCDYLNRETGLMEVSTLICGEALEVFEGQISYKTYWSPAAIARERSSARFNESAATLRLTTRACVRSWASLHQSAIVLVSGGLDSSIVLASLCNSPSKPAVRCITFYSPLAGDERKYAREVAAAYRVPLHEQRRNEDVDLKIFGRCARTASPVLHYSACDQEPTCLELARSTGSTLVMDGELGDNVFGVRGQEALLDEIARNGLATDTLSLAMDACILERVSLWSMILWCLKRACAHSSAKRKRLRLWSVRSHYREVLRMPEGFISKEALAAYERVHDRYIHPWLETLEGVPPSKYFLLWALAQYTSTTAQSPFIPADDSLYVSPLCSQPLVEEALRMPARNLIAGGEDRAAARRAFADELPRMILDRGRGKGTTDPWVRHIILRNRDFLKEFMLDGMLVSRGILDKEKIENALSGPTERSSPYLAELFEHLYAEAWARRWTAGRNFASA
ncbi:MAG TPA: asparagine synthase-related protein [Terriglobales bacterium]|nr:asparagine synthase-related protein [Terriglobales bacterium]